MKKTLPKKPAKDQRERLVLLGLVELYIKTGKPVGSNTLKECGFKSLSSATIRNYFAKLEEAGYVKQHHASGGRIPTELAYQLYSKAIIHSSKVEDKDKSVLSQSLSKETKEVALYLQSAIESISSLTQCAAFISSPRFDQDFVRDIKLVTIDTFRYLGVVVTDFGLVSSEVLHADCSIPPTSLKRIEEYLICRIRGMNKPPIDKEEEILAHRFYNEIMLRRIVSYVNFTHDDIFRTGLSRLIHYPDFSDATTLTSGLSLFENLEHLRILSKETVIQDQLSCWIGSELPFANREGQLCSVISVPYKIHQTSVGSISILGPHRLPYKRLFGVMTEAARLISNSLTNSLYKFKISYRQPQIDPGKLPSAFNASQQLPHLLSDTQDLELP